MELAEFGPYFTAERARGGVSIGTFLGVPVSSQITESTYHRLVGGLLLLLGIWLVAAAV